ncbi:MAG: DUF1285 domain-containing protein [Rhodospirillaceae bacterium]
MGIAPRPGQVVCGDIGMRIDLDGTWHYQGSPIRRKELVKLFSTVLRRDDAGGHWLITPAEIAPVAVDDAPFLAVGLDTEGAGPDQVIRFRTNIDAEVTLSADHPLRVVTDPETEEPAPYLALDHGLEAKLNRPVFYELVEMAVEREVEGAHLLGVWSRGDFHPIGECPPDADADTC